jgi:hypothetical protein
MCGSVIVAYDNSAHFAESKIVADIWNSDTLF